MVDTDALKKELFNSNIKQYELAQKLGISRGTLHNRMKSKIFMTNEIDRIVDILQLEPIKAARIFFALEFSQDVTKITPDNIIFVGDAKECQVK